jgi:hypothetical protein
MTKIDAELPELVVPVPDCDSRSANFVVIAALPDRSGRRLHRYVRTEAEVELIVAESRRLGLLVNAFSHPRKEPK